MNNSGDVKGDPKILEMLRSDSRYNEDIRDE